MQPSEPYILQSELAMRRHAVLMPAEVPAAKRRRTAGSSACARAHAFVSDSPLSPSKAPRADSAAAQTHNHGIIENPVESPDVSTGEQATFAVRTDSEPLELAPAPIAAQAAAEDTEMEVGSQKAHLQNASRPPESDNIPDSVGRNATSQQQSTADAGTSAPSTISYETSVRAALSTSEVDGPSSPHVPGDHMEAHVGKAEAMPALQTSSPQRPTVSAEYTTVPQLLLMGAYQVDAEQHKIVAQNLHIYKAKVDEVHALGRVSQQRL